MEEAGVIEKIEVGMPTPWCSSLHTVPKKHTGTEVDVRITMDPRDLNKALLREYHPINTLDEVITRINGSKFFTHMDVNMGYFRVGTR